MASLRSALVFFLSPWSIIWCADILEVTKRIGEDATLNCHGPQNSSVALLAWSRADLTDHTFVFFYRNHQVREKYQAQRYSDRVTLKDPEMKDGEASVILKNITLSDTGTYECLIGFGNARRRKRDRPDTFSIIKLKVTNPGHTEPGALEGGSEDGGGSHMLPAVSVIGAAMAIAMMIGLS